MNATKALLTSTYTAFNRRDINAVLATTHPDVDWAIGLEGGRLRGHEKVRDYWKRQWASFDFQVTPLMFEGSERSPMMVVNVHQVVRDRSGKLILERLWQHVFHIRDGLLERMDNRNPEAHDERAVRIPAAGRDNTRRIEGNEGNGLG